MLELTFYATLVLSIWIVGYSFKSLAVDLPQESLWDSPDTIAYRFNKETLTTGLTQLQELVKREDERFRHIDTKATNFYGIFGLCLAILTLIGPLILGLRGWHRKEEASASERYCTKRVVILYSCAVLALMLSFFFGMLSTQVQTFEPSKFLGFEVGSRYDVAPAVVYGEEYIRQDSDEYNRTLLAEYIKVYSRNVHGNDIKAKWLSQAQSFALAGGAFMSGVMLLVIMVIIFDPPRQGTPTTFPKLLRDLFRWSESSKEQKVPSRAKA